MFNDAFPVVDIEDEWEIFVEEQTSRVRRDTVNADNVLSDKPKLTQKSLVARRNVNVYLDPTDPNNHVLTISKAVVGTQEDKEKYFIFEMLFNPGEYIAYVLNSSNKVVTYHEFSKDLTFKLKDGQKLAFTNLPVDTNYIVREKKEEQYNVSVKIKENGILKTYTMLSTGQRTIGEKENSVEFTNTNRSLVTITVSKQVEGEYANRSRKFSFKIYLRDSNGNALALGTKLSYLGSVIEDSGVELPNDGILTMDQDGSATFELKHGQQIIITDVPPGQVRIHETEENPEYSTSYRDGNSAPIDRSDRRKRR